MARLHPNIARDAVALVENAENGNAIRHRSDSGLLARPHIRTRSGGVVCLVCSLILLAPAPGRQEEHQRRGGDGKRLHAQSGVQGW